MHDGNRFRFGLKAKILSVVLGLPLLCATVFGVILYANMLNLGGLATEGMKEVGHAVAEQSREELTSRARTELQRLAADEASFVNTTLAKVLAEVDGLSELAGTVWDGSGSSELADGYALAPGVEVESVQEEIRGSGLLAGMFPEVFFRESNLAFLYVATRGGVFRIYPWNEDMELVYEPRNDPWYRGAFTTGGIHWSPVFIYPGEKELMITCSRSFTDEAGSPLGVIGADVSLKPITDEITNKRVGERGYLVLLDQKGNVISRPVLHPGDGRWDESCGLANWYLSEDERLQAIVRDMSAGGTGIRTCIFSGGEKLLAYAPIPVTSWSLGVLMPMQEVVSPVERSAARIDHIAQSSLEPIHESMGREQLQFGLLFLVMVLLILFFGVRLANRITQPILDLARGARKVGAGDLDYRLEVKTGDEIEELSEAFHRMTEDLKAHMERLNRDTAKRERIEQARLMASGVQEMFGGSSSYDWLLPHMREERYERGHVLFRKGDRSDTLYIIHEGAVRLTEIGKRVGEGSVLGEMGMFRPSRERSLSAVCESDVRASVITHERLFDLYSRDPTVGFHLIQMITQRYVENLREETRDREQMESELRIARDIQTSTLPGTFPAFPERSDFDVFATMEPAREVGGDLYDFFLIDPERFCFLIGDVAGKGVPAALFMMTAKMLLKAALQGKAPLDEVLGEVNRVIASENTSSMFITLFCGILNTRTGDLEYGNAGHNPPLLGEPGRGFSWLRPRPNFVLGGMEGMTFVSERATLKPGSVLFTYTDGVTEALNGQGGFYSEARLLRILDGLRDQDLRGLVQGVREDVRRFAAGEAMSDDITMLAVRFSGGG